MRRKQWISLIALVLVALLWWWAQGDRDAPPEAAPGPGATSSPVPSTSRPTASLPAGLPAEVGRTLALIDAGGPFPYSRDGVVFMNREGLLPHHPRGYWHEYTVPTPGSDDRGARRLVVGRAGEVYYSDDHYGSFELLRAGRADRE